MQLSSASKMSKRERRPNFSDAELRALLSMYVENADILQAKFNNNITIKRKMAVWDAIAEAVSALGISRRGVQDARKKWMDLKSASLQFRSATKHQKTGGGKRPDEPWMCWGRGRPFLKECLVSRLTLARTRGSDTDTDTVTDTGSHDIVIDITSLVQNQCCHRHCLALARLWIRRSQTITEATATSLFL